MEKAANDHLEFRNERKFVVSGLSLTQMKAIVKAHPAMFSTAFPPRQVNNIYFDTQSGQYYQDNVIGAAERRKFRIRWYGDQFGHIAKPVMEIKIKEGLAGAKQQIPLPPFTLHPGFSINELRSAWKQSELPPEARTLFDRLNPTLLNRYRRQYYLSADRKFRVTLDDQLTFIQIGNSHNAFLHQVVDRSNIVLELKYEIQYDMEAVLIGDHFPFRLSRNSKYVNGMDQLNHW